MREGSPKEGEIGYIVMERHGEDWNESFKWIKRGKWR